MSQPGHGNHPSQMPPPPPPPRHGLCQQDLPDPVYMEIEYLAYQIRQSGATKPLLQKISTALHAYETIVQMEKRLVHARLEAVLAQIDVRHHRVVLKQEVNHQSPELSPETCDKNEKVNLDETFDKKEPVNFHSEEETKLLDLDEKQIAIEKQLDAIKNLPVLEDRKFIVPFSARVTTLCRALYKLDDRFQKYLVIANNVFLKVIDLLEPEWIEYVRNKRVEAEHVYLSVIADFLQEEALKEANKMVL